MVDATMEGPVKKLAYAFLVVLVALAVLTFVFDVPMAETLFDAVFPLVFLFFAYQALFVRGSAADPVALAAGVGLTIGAFTDWYALAFGESTLTTVGRTLSLVGMGAYLWLLVRSSRKQSETDDLDELGP